MRPNITILLQAKLMSTARFLARGRLELTPTGKHRTSGRSVCGKPWKQRIALILFLSANALPYVHAVNNQIPGVVENTGTVYLDDPDVTFLSYAAHQYIGQLTCSGIMVGPNVALTAAHCSSNPSKTGISFQVYRNQDPLQPDTQFYNCDSIVQALPSRIDLQLLYCENGPDGVPPGVKFGYLDFDTDPVRVGQQLYSFWFNPITNQGVPWVELYSPGQVNIAGTLSEAWAGVNSGIEMDIWSQAGASGSSEINPITQRIMVGPTTYTLSGEGAWRAGLSMYDYLENGVLDSSTPNQVNAALLASLGVPNPNQFFGSLDKDNNDLFDIQEAIEAVDGETQRDHYWLGYESDRRNAYWLTPSRSVADVQFQPHTGLAYLDIVTPGNWVLRHDDLNLTPNTEYRVSLMTTTRSSKGSNALEVAFTDPSGAVIDSRYLSTIPSAGWDTHSFHLGSGPRSTSLRILGQATAQVSVATLSLIEEGSVMDFDTYDKRVNWRNGSTGERAFIIPDGYGDSVDWAGLVAPSQGIPAAGSWPLRNRQLALVEKETYQICFKHKHYQGSFPYGDWGMVRIESGQTMVLEKIFWPNSTWTRTCTGYFTLPSGDNNLLFGLWAGQSQGDKSYIVDDIEIIRN